MMTLLDTLKSLLGLGSTDARSDSRGETGVTVEREPGGAPEPVSSPGEPDEDDEPHEADDESSAGTDDTDDESEDEAAEEETTEEPETDETDETSEPEATEDVDDEAAAAGTDEPTDVLEGIGPAYAERLSEAGVETVADLAAADLDSLAEEADVPAGRLETWIERAKNR